MVSKEDDINNGTYYLRVTSIERFILGINLDTWGIISFNPKIDIQLLFPYMSFCKDFQRQNPLVHEKNDTHTHNIGSTSGIQLQRNVKCPIIY